MTAHERTAVNDERALYVALALVIAVVFAVDCSVELGISVHLPYLAAVWLASHSRRPRVVWIATAVCSVALVVGYFVAQRASRTDGPPWSVMAEGAINHGFTLVALLFSAVIAYRSCIAQSRVRAGEQRFRAALASEFNAFVTIDESGAIQEWNARAEAVFGWTAEEVLGRNVVDTIIPPEHREAHANGIRRFLESGEAPMFDRRLELSALRRSGREFPVELTVWPVRERDGRYTFSAFIRDLSHRRQLARRFEAAVEASPAAFVMIDRRGAIVLANREFEVLFGYGREEVLGQPIEVLIPERFREKHPAQRDGFFAASQKRATGARGDFRALRKDGKEFPVVVGINALEIDGDLFAVSTIVDVTEIVQARQQIDRQVTELERSNQELEQFAYIASHDLQEPLRKISACCQVLAEDYAEQIDNQGKEWLNFAVSGAARMRQLVTDLLAYSRIGSRGKDLAATDANKACREAIDNLGAAVEESAAEIRCDALPTVVADDVQLAQVFQNLIGNAIKYRGAAPPRIDVGAELVDGKVRFHVRDNGIGIEPQFHERIFGIFQRLHGKDQYSGTGIGLAICNKAVHRMGGDIWVDSSAGAGSTFYFTLALAPTAVEDLSPVRSDGGTIAATTLPAGRIHATHRDFVGRR